jgi:hypothetical protein
MVLLWRGEEGECEGPGPHGGVLLIVHDGYVVRRVVYQPAEHTNCEIPGTGKR